MAKEPKSKSDQDRQTGNWSGNQNDERRPGNEDGEQAGQREYTEPSRKDTNSTGNSG
jgi:hypothetical protein